LIGVSAANHTLRFATWRRQLAKYRHSTQNQSSDDERLSDLVDCETLRPGVAGDSQTITV
jgi:hypothetical protein